MWERKFSDYDVYKETVTNGFSYVCDTGDRELWENENSYRLIAKQNINNWTYEDLKELPKKDYKEAFEYALSEMEEAEDWDERDLNAKYIEEQFK